MGSKVGLDKKQKLYGIPGAGVETAFVKILPTDLVTGNLYYFNHKLETMYPVVVMYDDTDKQIIPDECIAIDENRCVIDFSSYVGTWPAGTYYKIRAIGG